MEAMSASVHYHSSPPSQTSLAPSGTTHTQSASVSTSNPHLDHLAPGSSKVSRSGSLSLIGSARVRLAKDFRALIRTHTASSSLDRRYHRIRPTKREPSDAQELALLPSHAQYLSGEPSESDIESMENANEERRDRRGFGARLVGFLSRSRSRSRSKKRRSQSMDNIAAPVSEMPKPFQGGSLGRRNPYIVPEAATNTSASTSSASGSRPFTRSPSRPLSGATTATDTTAKPRTKNPAHISSKSQDMSSKHHVHLQADVLGANPEDPTRKAKKTNFFSVAITNTRKYEQPTEPAHRENGTPSPFANGQPNRRRWSGRFRSGSGSSVGTQSSRSNAGGDVARESPPPLPPKPGSSSKPTRPLQVVPPTRAATYTSLNSPPPPYRLDDFENAPPDELDLDGRCSPLCGLPSPRLTPVGQSSKGKERERQRAWTPQERSREAGDRQDPRRRAEVEITHPRRVGSPVLRERESRIDSRLGSRAGSRATAKPGPSAVPMEKVGSGSGLSRKSSAKDSSASAALKGKRTKHGSFDFERPVSVTGTATNMRTALRGLGVSFEASPLERSRSAKDMGAQPQVLVKQPQSSSLPSRTGTRPTIDTRAPPISRQPTDSSQGGNSTSTAGRSYFNYGDNDPISPISSNSGHSSSWGRKAGVRTLGPFKFEPAVPPIPGSPATDERDGRGARGAKDHSSPSKLRQEYAATKGRSLDLGLSLSWAPQKVREEAVLSYNRSTGGVSTSTGRVKTRWRGGAADEQGRLDTASSVDASGVAKAFKDALGDAAYVVFKTYVHRFDARAMPLNGPTGLITAASRLLDNAGTLDERGKQVLMDRFVRFIQQETQ